MMLTDAGETGARGAQRVGAPMKLELKQKCWGVAAEIFPQRAGRGEGARKDHCVAGGARGSRTPRGPRAQPGRTPGAPGTSPRPDAPTPRTRAASELRAAAHVTSQRFCRLMRTTASLLLSPERPVSVTRSPPLHSRETPRGGHTCPGGRRRERGRAHGLRGPSRQCLVPVLWSMEPGVPACSGGGAAPPSLPPVHFGKRGGFLWEARCTASLQAWPCPPAGHVLPGPTATPQPRPSLRTRLRSALPGCLRGWPLLGASTLPSLQGKGTRVAGRTGWLEGGASVPAGARRAAPSHAHGGARAGPVATASSQA